MQKDDPVEKAEAARDGATLQPNSGRGKFAKGDAILDDFVIDYKHYETGKFTVSINNIGKLDTDAHKAGNYDGVFKLILGEDHKVRRWVVPEYVIPRYIEYKNIVDKLSDKYPDIYLELS